MREHNKSARKSTRISLPARERQLKETDMTDKTMGDPTYNLDEIKQNPTWHIAWVHQPTLGE